MSGGPGASLHRVESRFTGLYVQCKAVALPRLFTQAGVHAVLNSPYAEREWYEDVREDVRKLSQTPEFAIARRARNKIEALFSELRNQVRLRKLRLRGLPRAGEQFLLAATVQNIKRLVRFINQSKEPESEMA